MVVIEMREAAQEKALDLVDELHELGHQKKMILCELEDALYDCFESSEHDEKEEGTEEGTDLGFKNKYSRLHAMRNFEDDDKDMEMRHSYRRRMGMRRNRMGRYV